MTVHHPSVRTTGEPMFNLTLSQPRSQGSLLPALWSERERDPGKRSLSLHRAGKREPWERGWHFLASLGAQENWYCTHIAHQCCDQLTAVKTGYPLTSITWPYRGLRCRPIEVEYLFEVIRWQVTSFQMIAGSSLIFFNSYEICCVYVPHN